MDYNNKVITWVFAAIGALAGVLYIEEWYRHRRSERRDKVTTQSPNKIAWWRKYLPVITVVCCICFIVSGVVWMNRIVSAPPRIVTMTNFVQVASPSQVQWYLRIKYIQCDPPARVYPFRVEVNINNRQFGSFPQGLFAYQGKEDKFRGGGSVVLERETKEYYVSFLVRKSARPNQEYDLTDSNTVSSVTAPVGYKTNELPITATNSIQLPYPLVNTYANVVTGHIKTSQSGSNQNQPL